MNECPDTTPGKPPVFATMLIRLSTMNDIRQAFLGDLEEEYRGRLTKADKHQADTWYWQQAARSLPHLARTAAGQTQLLALIGATIAGYLTVTVFDIYVARNAASAYARAYELESYLIPRLIYFLLKLSGVVSAGGLISYLTFKTDAPFWKNVRNRLAPLGLLLILPATWLVLYQSADYSSVYRLIWLAGIAPCLLAGAWVGARFTKR